MPGSHPIPARAPAARTGSWVVLGALGVGAVLLGVLLVLPNQGALKRAENARRELREEGFRLEYDEFAWGRDEPSVRRGREVLRLARDLDRRDVGRSPVRLWRVEADAARAGGGGPDPGHPEPLERDRRDPDPGWEEEGHRLLVELAGVLRAGGIQFPPDRDRGTLEVGYLHPLKSSGTHLADAAIGRLRAGDAPGAGVFLEALTRLATRPVDEPVPMAHLQAFRLQEVAFEVTWAALRSNAWEDAFLDGLQRRWMAFQALPPLPDLVALARVEALTVCRETRLESLTSAGGIASEFLSLCQSSWRQPTRITAWAGMTWRLWRRESAYRRRGSYEEEAELCVHYRQQERDMREAIRLPTWVAVRGHPATAVSRLALPPGGQWRRVLATDPAITAEGGLPVPAPEESLLAEAFEAEARRRLVLAALALARHRIRHGSWPPALEQLDRGLLDPALVDPMDGLPIRFRRAGPADGVLYSVGLNGVDDGGVGIRQAGTGPGPARAPDLVWPREATAQEVAEAEARLPRRPFRVGPGVALPMTEALRKRLGLPASAVIPAPAP